MEQNVFSLSNLIPHFSDVFQGNIQTAHGLSAFIVSFLLIVAVSFFVFACFKWHQGKKHIGFYFELLAGINQADLAKRQRDLTQKALQDKTYGKLWKEFDESLVVSPNGEKLFNTLDAAHFFNTSSLAMGLTDNRLLAAVPGFLTAIGVIGTFAGLQMGLASLELSKSANVEILQAGIGNMISGASIAFLTSVWGVFTSVTFNFIEKSLERGIRKRISDLQNRIDYLYPRITAEQSLVAIADHSRTSNETLQGLAEKIGDRLQEALIQTTDSIRSGLEDSLNQIMGPAIQSLVENAQNGSQKALDSLLGKFLDGVGDAGDSQKKMMEAASHEVHMAVGSLGQHISDFLGQLEEQNRRSEETSRERQILLEHQLKSLGEEQTGRQRQLGKYFEETIERVVQRLDQQQKESDAREHTRGEHISGVVDTAIARLHQLQEDAEARERARNDHFDANLKLVVERSKESVTNIGTEIVKQLNAQQDRDEVRQQVFSESVTEIRQIQVDLTNRVETLVNSQQKAFDIFYQKMGDLEKRFTGLADAYGKTGSEVFRSAQQMQSVTNQLGVLSANIKQAAEKLSSDVIVAAELTGSLAEDNRTVSREMKQVMESYRQLGMTMDHIADKLIKATEHAESGFTAVHQHLDSFKLSLKNQVEELSKHFDKLFLNYSERVQSQTSERLNTWNTQTNAYISSMTDAIRAISNVVDEIETKASSVV